MIQDDILPLLEEYCYEDYHRLERIMGFALVDVKNQQIRHDLFTPSQQTTLIQALLAPCPEITTSAQAAAAEEALEELQRDENDEEEDEKQGEENI